MWNGGVAPRINLGIRRRCVMSFTHWLHYLRAKDPGTHWREGWAGTRAVLRAVEKGKVPASVGVEPRSSSQ